MPCCEEYSMARNRNLYSNDKQHFYLFSIKKLKLFIYASNSSPNFPHFSSKTIIVNMHESVLLGE